MIEFINAIFLKKRILLIIVFAIAFITRLYLVYKTPQNNNTIDLNIYRDGGQLIINGINPYDYFDSVEIRNKLRLDSIAYTPWISETQERWDFYASGNLPLSLLFYGFTESISSGNPFFYRLLFVFIDALLAMFIALIMLENWKLIPSLSNFLLILGIGALSPTLLLWGCSFPEEKGLQILFMILAPLFASKKNLIWSTLFLGCSIAFKGLGIFIAPLCLILFIGDKHQLLKIDKQNIKHAILFIVLTIVFTICWFLPYMPEIFEMMQKRIEANMGVNVLPEHASIWTIAMKFYPNSWGQIKIYSTIFICLLWGYAFIVRRLNIAAISLFFLVLFVDILLLKGSLDRMNIGILISLIFFYFIDFRYAKILGWYTIIVGFFLYPPYIITNGVIRESIDVLYILGYVTLFCIYPLFFLLNRKPKIIE